MILRLLSYNIRHGGVGREARIANVIRQCDPDIVMLQEATHPAVVERLAGETGLAHWASQREHSAAFLSRIEIESHRWHQPHGVRRPFLEIKPAGFDLPLFNIHLSAVHSNFTERRRIRELRALLATLHPHKGKPHAVTGDFNTLAPGELLDHKRLPLRLRFAAWATGGRVKYETIALMLANGYSDGYRSLHTGPGFTFPTWDPHVRLDFVFLPTEFTGRIKACEVMYDVPNVKDASDHFPLLSQIEVP